MWNGLGSRENPDGKGWAAGTGYGAKILVILKAILSAAGGADKTAEAWYRVRKTWADAKSQKRCVQVTFQCEEVCERIIPAIPYLMNPGKRYTSAASFKPYLVKVEVSDLNIRKGPGTDCAKTGKYTGQGVFLPLSRRQTELELQNGGF